MSLVLKVSLLLIPSDFVFSSWVVSISHPLRVGTDCRGDVATFSTLVPFRVYVRVLATRGF